MEIDCMGMGAMGILKSIPVIFILVAFYAHDHKGH